MNLIITGANSKYFDQLIMLLSSVRNHGKYNDLIAICDNTIDGSWNKPGSILKGFSFSEPQLEVINSYACIVYNYSNLLEENNLEINEIESINTKTQRYPHKYIYNMLISLKYLNKVDKILYIDSDIYFQKPIEPIWKYINSSELYVSKEKLKIKDNVFLSKWVNYSDFTNISNQKEFLKQINNCENYSSGLIGGISHTFHGFMVLCFLLSSNRHVNFYSDQPLLNILTSFLTYRIKTLPANFCLHLGDLEKVSIHILKNKIKYEGMEIIAVHFNGDTKDLMNAIINGIEIKKTTRTQKFKYKLIKYAKYFKQIIKL